MRRCVSASLVDLVVEVTGASPPVASNRSSDRLNPTMTRDGKRDLIVDKRPEVGR